MKKVEGYAAEVLADIIKEGNSMIEMDGKNYYINLVEEPKTTVKEDIEADPDLKEKLLQAKKDIMNGNTYTTHEVIEMIEQGETFPSSKQQR